MKIITPRPRAAPNASKRPRRQSSRHFDPRKHPADRELMRKFTREADADTTDNPVYKAFAEYNRLHYADLLD